VKLASTRTGGHVDLCERVGAGPLLRPEDVQPSTAGRTVVGVFNPTYVSLGQRRFLIVRVEETISAPLGEGLESHLRLVELHGNRTTVAREPLSAPAPGSGQRGCEDPRAAVIEGRGHLTYTVFGPFGATVWLGDLSGPGRITSAEMVLGPDSKHGTLFPERIQGHYLMAYRPLLRSFVEAIGIWFVESPDLRYWGRPRAVMLPREGFWDALRVGPAASPIRLEEGWLMLYYGVDADESYHTGAALLSERDPSIVIGRSPEPILSPEESWERVGRRADTVFVCGSELNRSNDLLRLYYGAADSTIGVADVNLHTLLGSLQ